MNTQELFAMKRLQGQGGQQFPGNAQLLQAGPQPMVQPGAQQLNSMVGGPELGHGPNPYPGMLEARNAYRDSMQKAVQGMVQPGGQGLWEGMQPPPNNNPRLVQPQPNMRPFAPPGRDPNFGMGGMVGGNRMPIGYPPPGGMQPGNRMPIGRPDMPGMRPPPFVQPGGGMLRPRPEFTPYPDMPDHGLPPWAEDPGFAGPRPMYPGGPEGPGTMPIRNPNVSPGFNPWGPQRPDMGIPYGFGMRY